MLRPELKLRFSYRLHAQLSRAEFCVFKPSVTKAPLWFAELVLSYRTRTPFELEQALWFCLGAAGAIASGDNLPILLALR